jgi:protein gp37
MSTKIEWTDETWNPTLGCDKVSPGCDDCYAIRTATIRAGNPHPGIAEAYAGLTDRTDAGLDWTGTVRLLPERLDKPLRWRKPRRIFVDSQSDLFHQDVPDEFIAQVFAVMADASQHAFQVLTKRHGRMRSLLNDGEFFQEVRGLAIEAHGMAGIPWPLPNVWLGVSVEDQQRADLRIPALLDTPAAVRWLSCEPLLGLVDLSRWLGVEHYDSFGWGEEMFAALNGRIGGGLGWVVAGGESGPGARPMHPDWVRQLRDQCQAARVPFHFKQRGDWTWNRPSNWPVQDWATNPDRNLYVLPDGRRGPIAHTTFEEIGTPMYRVGKKAAGRELDGQLWDEFPAVR